MRRTQIAEIRRGGARSAPMLAEGGDGKLNGPIIGERESLRVVA
jgi:hypothetical protein